MFKALSDGHRAFSRIAVVADTEAPTPPCGACRQILWEFGGNLEVILANLTKEKGTHRLRTCCRSLRRAVVVPHGADGLRFLFQCVPRTDEAVSARQHI
jgi:hypothetical protein